MRKPKKARPKRGPAFPASSSAHDDDLPPTQRRKLEGASDNRHTYRGPSASTDPVVQVPVWECPTHGIIVRQGQACPECGKKLLLD